MKANLLIITLCIFISACTSVKEPVVKVKSNDPKRPNETLILKSISKEEEAHRGDPNFAPIRDMNIGTVQQVTGSLFNPNQTYSIYQNNNTYEVGDMILVKLNEKITSKKSLSYKTNSKDDLEITPDITAGNLKIDTSNFKADYEHSKGFDSSSASNQNNSLSGSITVSIREKLANGNLVVAGEKWFKLNKGDEFIRFSGEIRIDDIDTDRSIDSIKVGNAQIEVSGKGEMKDNQDASLLTKLMSIFG